VAARRPRDAIEEKIPNVAVKAADAKRQQVATEEQCECLVPELTPPNLRGSELCMTITSTLPQAPLHEGMHFVAVHHT
jgi:hypothetical protein